MTFGWEAPLTVNGQAVPITGYLRHDNPWAQTTFNTRSARISDGGYSVDLDVEHAVRSVSGPASAPR
jgi:hypothetical protein